MGQSSVGTGKIEGTGMEVGIQTASRAKRTVWSRAERMLAMASRRSHPADVSGRWISARACCSGVSPTASLGDTLTSPREWYQVTQQSSGPTWQVVTGAGYNDLGSNDGSWKDVEECLAERQTAALHRIAPVCRQRVAGSARRLRPGRQVVPDQRRLEPARA